MPEPPNSERAVALAGEDGKCWYQCPGQFIGFRAKVSFSTSNEKMFSL